MFNAYGAETTRELQANAFSQSRPKIPLLFGLDVIHGYRTILPIPLDEAASWDLEAIEKSARDGGKHQPQHRLRLAGADAAPDQEMSRFVLTAQSNA